ncbi:hypothetical protein QWY99_22105 [Flavobacterium branchiarum]|uniref:Phage terminase large subunit-like protein n=1 Tax=Flavobacterium branchiarum TaxID=1114870 RepID=A0ABV5FSL8_9FLAO|nr:hypothetical protein [Flavobacterium branchiarum]MDN3671498.1 hypothetical protein [Flavobacterium branchiarum]MDN3672625.1 hypothetical protein [Flavobacterium branchiarum]MDN3675731.1 hypothetical protein [Flavobacterium branchiarum]
MAKRVTDKEYLELWREFCENMDNATPIDLSETHSAKIKRKQHLEKHPEEWFKYYFPMYYTSEPAPFHIRATKRVIANPEWYEVRSWSRELSKSGRTMMETLYLGIADIPVDIKVDTILLVSDSLDNAERLLLPYKGSLESNNRIINDYGVQKKIGGWESTEFTTRKGLAFRGIGAGQSPRGTRNKAKRPNLILIDDIDTDEICRNPERVKERVKWIEQALIPTRSISSGLRIIACGNIIAKYCCITEMGKKADIHEVINIRDKEGKSTWPQKNTEANIDRVLSLISYESYQKEYFNNPMDGGDTFKDIIFEKCPQLRHCDNVVIYADPAPSNSDKTNASSKAITIVANKGLNYYIQKVWVDQMSNAKFCEYLFEAHDICKRGGVDPVYIWIENNSLQNPFYEQVILPHIYRINEERNSFLPIRPDDRKKPEKYARIEGGLEPLNRLGHLIFNVVEKTNPHMERLVAQFTSFSRKAKLMDGPDCVEGAVWTIKEVQITTATGAIESFKRQANKHRM